MHCIWDDPAEGQWLVRLNEVAARKDRRAKNKPNSGATRASPNGSFPKSQRQVKSGVQRLADVCSGKCSRDSGSQLTAWKAAGL